MRLPVTKPLTWSSMMVYMADLVLSDLRGGLDVCRAERDNGGGCLTCFVVGGAIFGALGFLFAPEISAALLNDEQRLRLPKFLDEEEKSPEATKQVSR